MSIVLADFWDVDPLPTPPAAFGTMAYWRFWSQEILRQRAEARK